MVNEQVKIFEKENPQLKDLNECKDKDILLWAEKERFLTRLIRFEGKTYYTDFDLKVAKMWSEKK